MEINVGSPEMLADAAAKFVAAMQGRLHYAFRAPMGAGKTTFISAVCAELGSSDEASSPTFSIVNEYARPDGMPIYHFDFYRIEDEEELLDMGVEDYWDNGSVCLIEWPEMAEGHLPDDVVEVEIRVNDDNSRTIIVSE